MTRPWRAALAAALAALSWSVARADPQCLACHAGAGIDAKAFAGSVHAPNGCASCHAGVDLGRHPPAAPTDKAAFRRVAAQACGGCHAEIAEAYAGSHHGRANAAAGDSPAPLCADCHSAHEVDRASVGTHLRDTCLSCHALALAAHEKWLPNTRRHFDTVSCAACHAPGLRRKVDLRLYDVKARAEATGKEAAALLAQAGNGGAKPLDGARLREIVRAVNAEGSSLVLVGRLEARNPVDSHRLADRGKAVKECTGCHSKGAEAFQNVTLSFIGADGRRVRYEAKNEVLSGAASVESIRGFYAMGGTRIGLLDVVLGLALAGGISAPLGHFVVRRIMRRKERRDA